MIVDLRFTAAVGAATLLVSEISTPDWMTPSFFDGLGTVGTWTLVIVSVITGRGGLALLREVKDRDKTIEAQNQTIEWQRKTIEEKDDRIKDLTWAARISAGALDKVTDAAVAAGGDNGHEI